ncbi:hypothetical protein ACFS07_28305 [Undibacterium arcticum]
MLAILTAAPTSLDIFCRHRALTETLCSSTCALCAKRGLISHRSMAFSCTTSFLSIETIAAGLGVYAAPQLACWHGSKGNQGEFDREKSTDAFNEYLLIRLRNRSINTLNGPISIQLGKANPLARAGIDLDMDSLRTATRGRYKKKVAIVTRTQFARLSLLSHTLDSVGAFIAAAGSSTEFRSYVVTDNDLIAPEWVSRRSTVLRADLQHGGDSRYQLVRFAAEKHRGRVFLVRG